MIAAVVVVAIAIIIGAILTRTLFPAARGEEFIGVGFLLGIGAEASALFLLSLAGIRWTALSFLIACAAIGAGGAIAVRYLRNRVISPIEPRQPLHVIPARIVDVVALVVLFGYGAFATAGPLPEFDFLTNWGMRGRVFWEHRGIDWPYLESPWGRWFQSDYPPLLPLMFDSVAVLGGRWDDRSIGLLFVCFGAAALLIVRDVIRRETRSELIVSLATLALLSAAVAPWVGLGEGPLLAYGAAAIFLLRDWLLRGTQTRIAAAVLLGFGGLIKNEGLTLIVAATAALFLAARTGRIRAVLPLWPAYAMAGLWQVLRLSRGLSNYLSTGDPWPRVIAHLREPGVFIEGIIRYGAGKPWFWIGIILALLLGVRRSAQREAFVFLTILFQLIFYIGAYAVSPFEIGWHVQWSWERLLFHLTLPVATVALLAIIPLLDFRASRSIA